MPNPRKCPGCGQELSQPSVLENGAEICPLCGTPMDFEPLLPQGYVIAGFRVERLIGRGGMGTVYLATQMNLERPVALKILSKKLAKDSEFIERFFREARAAAALSHPNIVQAYDAGAGMDGTYYFAMELVEGETLEARIAKTGKLPPETAALIGIKIADALNYAWVRQRLCHGDVKPENIIIDNSADQVKLADLGLAKSIHDESKDSDLMATPLYAPPELIMGQMDKIGFQSDMYSFGATLFHMLAGEPPFPGDDPNEVMARQLNERPPHLSEKAPKVPPELSSLVSMLLEKKTEARPDSWDPVISILASQLGSHENIIRTRTSIRIPHEAPKKRESVVLGATEEAQEDPEAARPEAASEGVPEEPVQDKSKKLFWVAAVVGVMAFAAICAGGIVAYRHGAQEGKRKQAIEKAAQSEARNQAEAEWATLSPTLQDMRLEQALDAIQAYLERNSGNSPLAARDAFVDFKARLLGPFKNSIASLKTLAQEKDHLKKSGAELRDAIAKIEEVFAQAVETPHLGAVFQSDDKAALQALHDSISAELAKRKTAEDANRKAELERVAKERKEQAEIRKKEADKAAEERLIKAKSEASIEKLLKTLISKLPLDTQSVEARTELAAALSQELDATRRFLPPDIADDMNLLLKAAKMPPAFPDILIDRCDSCLKGKPLPTDHASGFLVDGADASFLRFYQDAGKARIGKKLPWSVFKQERLDSILKSRVLSKEGALGEAPKKLQEALLADLLLRGASELFNAALKESSLPAKEKSLWSSCAKTLFSAKKEAEAIKLWNGAKELIASGAFPEAVSALDEIKRNFASSKLMARRSAELDHLLRRYKELSPDYIAQELDARTKEQLARKNRIYGLALASSAVAKLGSSQKTAQKSKTELDANRAAAIGLCKSANHVKELSDAKLPFYFWDREEPGDAWIYKEMVDGSDVFKKGDPLFKMMALSAGVDAGVWDDATQLKNLPVAALAKAQGPLRNWAPSINFGLSVVADRFQMGKCKADLVEAMKSSVAQLAPDMKRVASHLPVEQAMLFRKGKAAIDMIAANIKEAQKEPRDLRNDLRDALLSALANMSSHALKLDEERKLLSSNLKQFDKPDAKGDIRSCQIALDLLSGKGPDAKELNDLKTNKDMHPDLCARIIADALAKGLVTGSLRKYDPAALIRELEGKLTSGAISTELWERLMAMKIAAANDPKNMIGLLSGAIRDPRLCALPCYPRLVLLNAAAQVACGNLTEQAANSYCESFLDGCPLRSANERSFDKLVSPDASMRIVSSLLAEGESKEALWLATVSAIANQNDAKHRKRLADAFAQCDGVTWAERLMLTALCD